MCGKSGLPKYKYEMKDNIVLKDIFKTDQEMRKIERLNSQGYKKFLDEIKKYNIFINELLFGNGFNVFWKYIFFHIINFSCSFRIFFSSN